MDALLACPINPARCTRPRPGFTYRGGNGGRAGNAGGANDERSLLDGWLDYYRATLLVKCEGLAGEELIKRSCEPSPMSLIGLSGT